jgi:hypothetical protein
MKDEGKILTGWQAIRMFLKLSVTPVLTTLVMAIPISWLVNQEFATGAIHAIFGVEHLGYWRVVGLFAIRFAIRGKIGLQETRK